MRPPAEVTALTGRVLEFAGGTYRVDTPRGIIECSLRGRAKRDPRAAVAVGDRVEVEAIDGDTYRISEVLPRDTLLARGAPHGRRQQAIAANVDQFAAVISAANPAPDLFMLDRLLALAAVSGIPALIVLNKIDLLADPPGGSVPALPDELVPYRRAAYHIVCTSARTGHGLDELRRTLAGRTTALGGPSGVGKSSMVNRLIPGLDRRVGDVAPGGRGRKTTVRAALLPLPGGGYIADTPGIQYVGMGDVRPAELAAAFPEIGERADECRFADCRHRSEPGCAVHEAVAAGEVHPRRHESYLALLEEAAGA